MELVATKILVLTLLGVLRLVCGLLPLKIAKGMQEWGTEGKRRKKVDVATSLCLCFGGGVLMATCFIHMIPEVRASLDTVRLSGSSFIPQDSTFPLAELLICCGFFLVYILEEIAHHIFLRSHHLPPPAKQQCCPTIEFEMQRQDIVVSPTKVHSLNESSWSGSHDIGKVTTLNDVRRSGGGRSHKVAPATSQIHLLASTLTLDQDKQIERTSDIRMMSGQHHNMPLGDDNKEQTLMGNLRNFLVVIALSFHSLFEGMAIGLQPTEGDVWYLFTAVSIHAAAILFCIGLELATSGAKILNIVVYIVTLAVVSPLGVVVGILVTVNSATGTVLQTFVIAVLQGIAGGTILYITFFEVLEREKKKEVGCGAMRTIFILFGFSLMVGLQVIGGHDHGAPGGHSLSNYSVSRDLHLDHDHDT